MKRIFLLLFPCLILGVLVLGCGDEEVTTPSEPSLVGFWKRDTIDVYLAYLPDGTLCVAPVDVNRLRCITGTYSVSGSLCIVTLLQMQDTLYIVTLDENTVCFGEDAAPVCFGRILPSQFPCDCP